MSLHLNNDSGLNKLVFDNQFVEQLPADKNQQKIPRQVLNACYSWVKPTHVKAPKLVVYSKEVAEQLGLSEKDCEGKEFAEVFTQTVVKEAFQSLQQTAANMAQGQQAFSRYMEMEKEMQAQLNQQLDKVKLASDQMKSAIDRI